jgi:hypothetical protein
MSRGIISIIPCSHPNADAMRYQHILQPRTPGLPLLLIVYPDSFRNFPNPRHILVLDFVAPAARNPQN